MKIEKNGKTFEVKENKTSWTVSRSEGNVSVSYTVPKDDCQTFDALTEYVVKSELF